VVLKLAEGLSQTMFAEIKKMVKKNIFSMLGALLMMTTLNKFRKRFDYQEYGGAPLLGVDGICIITHGRAKAKAIKNAIRMVKIAADHGFLEALHDMKLIGVKQNAGV